MRIGLIVALSVLTYASRALGFTITPRSGGRIQTILERLPAPLFAALAVVALVDDTGDLQSTTSVVASAFALAATFTRSLPIIFAAGIGGYLVSKLLAI